MRRFFFSILVLIPLCNFAKSVKINDVYLVHEDSKYGEKGLTLKISFDIEGCLNESCDIVALFYNSTNGAQIPKSSSGYKYDNKWLCTSKDFKPSYSNSTYTKLEMFIPYSAFELPNNPYALEVEFYIRDTYTVLLKLGRYKFTLIKLDKPCFSCGGSGDCFLCHGLGGRNAGNMYTGYYWMTCNNCYGKKYCTTCGGKKYLSLSKSMAAKNESNSIPSSNYRNSGTVKIKTNRKKCTLCNNGRIKMPISAVNPDYIEKCSECGELMKYSKHIHQDCSTCYGTGYIETNEAVIE